MSFHAAELQRGSRTAPRTSGLILQRKCACGRHTIGGGTCAECAKKKRQKGKLLQRKGRRAGDSDLWSPALSQGINPDMGHDSSRVALGSEPAVEPTSSPLMRTLPQIQRAPAEIAPSIESPAVAPAPPQAEAAPTQAEAAPTPESAPTSAQSPEGTASAESATEPATEAAAPTLLVEDEATDLSSGQMRRAEFLAQLRSSVCAAAEAAMAGTGQSTTGCPYVDYWFGYYENKSSRHIEQALHRYAPETRGVTSAQGYIPLVAARVRGSVETWAHTGEITGVPEGIPLDLPGTGLLGSVGGLAAGIGSLLFKAREGGARNTQDPQTIQSQLGQGHSLDAGVRSRMESAFGRSFAHVQTHMDASAAGLSSNLNARAFTVGEHVAFGSGEYRPGTMVGDALIAHELAHVVQQGGGNTSVAPMEMGGASYNALEEDADQSAVGVVLSLWGGAKGGLPEVARSAIPQLRSGLRLSRCSQQTTSQSNKTVTINVSVLNGATNNSARDIQTSNNIFSRSSCGLTIAAGTPQSLNPTQTSAILGTNNLLEEPSGATVSTEEQQLVTNNRTSGRITAYYVPGFNPSKRGTSLQSPRHGVPDSLLMGPSAATDTFTHELGHVLGRDPTHHGDANNLMARGRIRNVGVDNVNSTQCIDFLTKTSYPQ